MPITSMPTPSRWLDGVTRGILVDLDNEAELAALLGHELGHVNASTRRAAPRSGNGCAGGNGGC